jgi:hypothetical protein
VSSDGRARRAGADYLYRVNDDTEFRTRWAGALTHALASFPVANLGVVRPSPNTHPPPPFVLSGHAASLTPY